MKKIASILSIASIITTASVGASDYNNDGKADILFETTDGTIKSWFLSRDAQVGQIVVAPPTETSKVVSEGDYNNDGFRDMIAKKSDGSYEIWYMNATGKTKNFLAIANGWSVVGSGDFDGDGFSDILWRQADDSLTAWYMGSTGKKYSKHIAGDTVYNAIRGLADISGDGNDDIILRKSNGDLKYWTMNGTGRTSGVFITKDRERILEGLGDFDNNGFADLLWRKSDGSTVVWYMGTAGKQSSVVVTGPALSGWAIVDVEDYDNNGNSDILFEKEDGSLIIWFMGSTGKIGKYDVTADRGWKILGNSVADLLYNIDFTITHAINNKGAYVTSQCYTKTEDTEGGIHNPCFSCHINSEEPSYVDDPDLQESYDMGEYTKINRFTNLFKDRTHPVSNVTDEEILSYVRQNNYKDSNNTLLLAEKLKNVPAKWDRNENGTWDGYVPDCYFDFDSEGFDKTPEGNYTGWRAFGYYPFLGTFWPTNGSTDDVLIRLPEVFRKDANGDFNLTIYKVNLAIVEALIKKENVTIDPVDENVLGVDLNQDGNLSTATQIVFNWVKPDYNLSTGLIENFSMWYVGAARPLQVTNEYLIAPGLYPKGTDFLHSVRYIDIDENGTTIKMASRMKELRYGKKTYWNTYSQLSNATMSEIKEKDDFPERLRTIRGNAEEGLETGLGWIYQGFIEDQNGDLRPQNYEETMFCIGCHSGIGAIEDSTFVFPRKLDYSAYKNGWYHWTQSPNGLKDIPEPKTKDGLHDEYAFYLEQNHAGDEFRANDEVMNKFFDANGTLIASEVNKIKADISYLLYPSVSRALMLNKAYKIIVDEQSFIYGRDAHVKPVQNVHKEVTEGQSTGVTRVEY